MKHLFVCSMGLLRSPTAARLWRKHGYIAKHCGIHSGATVPFSTKLYDWADEIYALENEHEAHIESRMAGYRVRKPTTVLGIRDIYERDDPALIELLTPWLPHIRNGKLSAL